MRRVCSCGTSALLLGLKKLAVVLANPWRVTLPLLLLVTSGFAQFDAGMIYPTNVPAGLQGLVGDFNGDGKPDLVAFGQNGQATQITVRLGQGDGTFGAPIVSPSSLYPALRSGAVGDFNGDGKLDVVLAGDCASTFDCSDGIIAVFLGDGTGSFTMAASYTLPGIVDQPFTVAVGDFNGDSKRDVVVTLACTGGSCQQGAILVYPGNGNGTLGTPASYPTVGNSGMPVRVGDVNGDGKLDIVAGNIYAPNDTTHSSLYVLLGDGTGSFTESNVPLSFYGVQDIALADFNGDGRLDVAATGYYANLQVMLGNGDGTFQTATQVGTTNTASNASVSAADFNGDGKPDLVIAGSTWGTSATVLLGDGTGNFAESGHYYGDGSNMVSTLVADFNKDGKADLAIANYASSNTSSTGSFTAWLGNGDGTLRSAVTLANPGAVVGNNDSFPSVTVADLNHDGIPDIIRPSSNQGTSGIVSVFLGTGKRTYASPLTLSLNSGGSMVGPAIARDFNGDGNLDIAVLSDCVDSLCAQGGVVLFLGNGDGTFQSPSVYGTGGMTPINIVVGDVNGDGKLDLIVANRFADPNANSGTIGVLLGNGNGTFQPTLVTTPLDFRIVYGVAAADLNGDGRADVVVLGSGTDPNSTYYATLLEVFTGNSDGSLTTTGQTYTGGGAVSQQNIAPSVALGDLNGDGKTDIIVTSPCSSQSCNGVVDVLLGTGNAAFSVQPTVYLFNNLLSSAELADVDGDGKLDLVTSTPTGVYVASGKGDGTFSPGTVYATVVRPAYYHVTTAVADLDGDGSPEIVVPGLADGPGGLVPASSILYNRTPPPAVPAVQLSQTSLNFGMQQVGGKYPIPKIQLTNIGTGALTISGIQKTGTNAVDFSETDSCPATLAPGGACALFITFTPSHLGPLTASITINDDASDSPQSIALSGTAVDFSVSAVPGSNTVKGGKAATYNVSVTPLGGNTGSAALTVSGCPKNATCTLSPTQLTLNGSTASGSVLTVKGNGKTAKGNYTLTITGTVFTVSHSTTVSLSVQ